jgi:phosphate transport system substrate-binding protein
LKRLAGIGCAAAFVGCAFVPTAASARQALGRTSYTIAGAGSTLVAPLEAEWASAWDNASHNTVTYNADGSGTGYGLLASNDVDFAGSDAPLSAYSQSCNSCVQIPWGLTATGVSYNLGKIHNLRLTGSVLANIYLGKITNWDNSAIKRLNPKLKLPNLQIQVFWRNDASGDSFAFTSYLSRVSSAANKQFSGGTVQPTFPVGQGAHGNGQMASAVQANSGAIAYVAVSYLANDGLPAAAIKNAAGNYEYPNLNEIEAAASVVKHIPSNNQLTIVDPPKRARDAYVISTFTYAMLPTQGGSRFSGVPGSVIKQFIYYALHGGQQFAAALDFARLPKIVVNAADSTLGRVSNS